MNSENIENTDDIQKSLYRFAPHFALLLMGAALINRSFTSGLVPYQISNSAINALMVIGATLWVASLRYGGSAFLYIRRGTVPLILFILCSSVSIVYSQNRASSVQQCIQFALPALMVLSLLYSASARVIRSLLALMLGCSIPLALYGLYQKHVSLELTRQMVAKNPQMLESLGELKGMFLSRLKGDDIFSSFITSNSLGIYMVIIVIAAGAITVTAFKKNKILFGSVGLAIVSLLVWILILTKSKGSYGAFALTLCGYAFLKITKKTYRYAVALGVIVVAATYFTLQWDGSLLSMSVRWEYWRAGFAMWTEHPFLGVGIGTFGDWYAYYKTLGGWEVQKAHNNFLQLFCEIGLVGGFSVLAFHGLPLLSKNKKTEKKDGASDGVIGATDIANVGVARPDTVMLYATIVGFFMAVIFAAADGSRLFDIEKQHFIFALFVLLCSLGVGVFFFTRGFDLLHVKTQRALFKTMLVALIIHSAIDFDFYVPTLYILTLLVIASLVSLQNFRVQPLSHKVVSRIQVLGFTVGISVYFVCVYPYFTQAQLLNGTVGVVSTLKSEQILEQHMMAIEQGICNDAVYSGASQAALLLARQGVVNWKDGMPIAGLAESFARQAIEANPRKAGNYVVLARTLRMLHGGDAQDEITALLRRAVELYPYRPWYRLQLMENYIAQGNIAEAQVSARTAKEIHEKITDERTRLKAEDLKRIDEVLMPKGRKFH